MVRKFDCSTVAHNLWSITASVTIPESLLHTLLMLSIAEVDLEIFDRRTGSRSVKLPRTVMAPDAREILIFELSTRRGSRASDWHHGLGVNSSVSHHALEGIVGVRLLQPCESGLDPTWGLRLQKILVPSHTEQSS